MGRSAVAFPTQRCRILRPLSVALLVLACLTSHACGSCLSYGHSCWGAHGKRSGGQDMRGYARGGLLEDPLPSSPASSSETSDPLLLISMLKASTQREPGGRGGDNEDKERTNVRVWQLLDPSERNPANRRLSRTGNRHVERVAVPPYADFGADVGIIGFASSPSGEAGREVMLIAEDPEGLEEESEDEDSSEEREDTTEDGLESRGDERGREGGHRIRKLWDNMHKKRD